jgi:RNA polymerase sigma-70 factor (ECF subfamily)
MGEKQTDLELVRRVQAGDKSAFDVLVIKYQQKVINLVMRYVHDPHIAMDVSQESFIKAYRGLKNFRGDSAFYTWLYRISINTAKNYLVSKGRRMPDDDIDAQEAEQYDGGGKLREISTPEREALTEEIQATVQNAIEALPDDLRIAITLRELEGLSYEEISETMDCPIGTVRSRIFRARESIESELAPLLDMT